MKKKSSVTLNNLEVTIVPIINKQNNFMYIATKKTSLVLLLAILLNYVYIA